MRCMSSAWNWAVAAGVVATLDTLLRNSSEARGVASRICTCTYSTVHAPIRLPSPTPNRYLCGAQLVSSNGQYIFRNMPYFCRSCPDVP